jgi:hypothetical protein
MAGPLIAVVGSAELGRTYEPPLKNHAKVTEAAEGLGRELARAGCRLIVYSGETQFIEPAFVRGFLATKQAKPQSIQVRYPADDAAPTFPEQATQQKVFDFQPDSHPKWEVSFYRSLAEVDGVIVIGGGRSSLVSGLIALSYRIPVVVVATFGGAAQDVWTMIAPGKDLIELEERNLMGQGNWLDSSAAELVKTLKAQQKRIAEEEASAARTAEETAARYRALVEVLFLVGAMALAAWGLFASDVAVFAAAFFGVPVLAGGAGALVRTLRTPKGGAPPKAKHFLLQTSALGMTAGLIAALLFAVAQLTTNPEIKKLGTALAEPAAGIRWLVVFELIIGFIAGLTMDAVFTKLEGMNVLDADLLQRARPGGLPGRPRAKNKT